MCFTKRYAFLRSFGMKGRTMDIRLFVCRFCVRLCVQSLFILEVCTFVYGYIQEMYFTR